MNDKSLLLLGLIFAGCVPSRNPLYTEKDLEFDLSLLGVWALVVVVFVAVEF